MPIKDLQYLNVGIQNGEVNRSNETVQSRSVGGVFVQLLNSKFLDSADLKLLRDMT